MITERPKLNIPITLGERIWNIVGYASYLSSVFLLIYVWDRLPDQVPAHFNALGEVDRWGSKWMLSLLPLIGLILFIMMRLLEKYPHVHNYPERLNHSNASAFYLNSRKLINQIKNISLLFFAILLFESIAIAMGWSGGLGKWFLPLMIFGLGAPIVVALLRQRKIK